MRRAATDSIVIHCSATRPQLEIGAEQIREWHLARKFADIGYHAVIRRNGIIEFGRHFDEIGAHVAGRNSRSTSICLVGGLYPDGTEALDDFQGLYTVEQTFALRDLLHVLMRAYPKADVIGHRDLSPDKNMDGKITPDEWLKSCPGFDVQRWCRERGLA